MYDTLDGFDLSKCFDDWNIVAFEQHNLGEILSFLSCRKLGLRAHEVGELHHFSFTPSEESMPK